MSPSCSVPGPDLAPPPQGLRPRTAQPQVPMRGLRRHQSSIPVPCEAGANPAWRFPPSTGYSCRLQNTYLLNAIAFKKHQKYLLRLLRRKSLQLTWVTGGDVEPTEDLIFPELTIY